MGISGDWSLRRYGYRTLCSHCNLGALSFSRPNNLFTLEKDCGGRYKNLLLTRVILGRSVVVSDYAKVLYPHPNPTRGEGAPMCEIFIDLRESKLTLTEVIRKIEDIQSENPDLEIFLDGDMLAIRGRPRPEISDLRVLTLEEP
ncbi:MAG: hypothetical protein PWQ62_179 [Candidatus Methanomethylophilaceae archaeon]|nr:hypothetical protein [Candidatus Methanomethylophilaceae archaeon]